MIDDGCSGGGRDTSLFTSLCSAGRSDSGAVPGSNFPSNRDQ